MLRRLLAGVRAPVGNLHTQRPRGALSNPACCKEKKNKTPARPVGGGFAATGSAAARGSEQICQLGKLQERKARGLRAPAPTARQCSCADAPGPWSDLAGARTLQGGAAPGRARAGRAPPHSALAALGVPFFLLLRRRSSGVLSAEGAAEGALLVGAASEGGGAVSTAAALSNKFGATCAAGRGECHRGQARARSCMGRAEGPSFTQLCLAGDPTAAASEAARAALAAGGHDAAVGRGAPPASRALAPLLPRRLPAPPPLLPLLLPRPLQPRAGACQTLRAEAAGCVGTGLGPRIMHSPSCRAQLGAQEPLRAGHPVGAHREIFFLCVRLTRRSPSRPLGQGLCRLLRLGMLPGSPSLFLLLRRRLTAP